MKIEKTILNKDTIIDLSLIKQQLIIDNDYIDDDVLLQFYIDSAIEFIENKIHGDIYQKECTLSINDYNGKDLIIEETPLNEITEIQIDNSIITGYTVNSDSFIDFRIEFDDYLIDSDIIIKFNTGFETVPTPLLHCIMLLVNDSYEYRGLIEGYSEKSQLAVLNKITPYIRNYY